MKNMTKKKILIIEPHSDDSCLASAGFFIKNKDKYEFNFCLITASDLNMNHAFVPRESRLKEYQEFVDYFNGNWVKSSLGNDSLPLDYESRLDSFSKSRLVAMIEKTILEIKPNVLMFMGPSFHHDHTIVYEAVIAATRPTFCYVPEVMYVLENATYVHKGNNKELEPNTYVELSESILNEKVKIFHDIFVSQRRSKDNYLSNEGIVKWAQYRGIEARCDFSEAFCQIFSRI